MTIGIKIVISVLFVGVARGTEVSHACVNFESSLIGLFYIQRLGDSDSFFFLTSGVSVSLIH